ncbi:MAG: copper-binding protein [Sulfuricella sp.]|nr:copper-binding protein [Sulfuricella sp.]
MKKVATILIATLFAGISAVYAGEAAVGKGTVNKIDPAGASVNLSHEAIPAIKWPAMTMDIKVADKKLLSGVKPGQTVTFGLTKDPQAGYVISRIEAAK